MAGVAPAVRLYLQPLGLLAGESAQVALDRGWARPLGEGGIAFTACRIRVREPSGFAQSIVPVSALENWSEAKGEAVGAALARVLARLSARPALPATPRPETPLIMGVVNVTPDSFSDGGRFFRLSDAIAQGQRLWQEGAAIIDVGGESTRPGAAPVPAEEEIDRVVPVVRALAEAGIEVSIDSRKAAVMAAAIEAGARMINDVSALRHDPESLRLAAGSGLPVVLMHSQGDPATMQRNPTYEDVTLDVYDELEERVEACVAAGISRQRLLIDPGIGFGKTLAHNIDLLNGLSLYLGMGLPVVLGASRKAFIGRLADEAAASERLPGSLAAALLGLANGASMIRAHDVGATRQAVRVWQAVMLGAPAAAAC